MIDVFENNDGYVPPVLTGLDGSIKFSATNVNLNLSDEDLTKVNSIRDKNGPSWDKALGRINKKIATEFSNDKQENNLEASVDKEKIPSFKRLSTAKEIWPQDSENVKELAKNLESEFTKLDLNKAASTLVVAVKKGIQLNIKLKPEEVDFLNSYNESMYFGELSLAQVGRFILLKGIKAIKEEKD